MSWLNQFSLVMRSSMTTLKEKVEDPERMLHQLLIDMEEELDRVKCGVAEAVADEVQLRSKAHREVGDAELWAKRATDAIGRGNEPAARAALAQKLAAEERADRYQADHERQKVAVEKLRRSVDELEDKARQAKQKKTLLAARMTRATSTRRIHQTLDRTHSQSAMAQFNRFEEKVDREEAIGEAWQRLQGVDPEAEELAFEFERQEREQRLVAELERLKAATGSGKE